MKKVPVRIEWRKILADIITPVSIYLKVRDIYPNSLLLESSDYNSKENSFSFICMDPLAEFLVKEDVVTISLPGQETVRTEVIPSSTVVDQLNGFISSFEIGEGSEEMFVDGVFGYSTFDAVQYFEDIKFQSPMPEKEKIPELRYNFFRFVLAINHLTNELMLFENIVNGGESEIDNVTTLLHNRNLATYGFGISGDESSNISDAEYRGMVTKGKEHCFRGDVFQIVLSRQFQQSFTGDEFNVYRALRSINPSPYLFYFDYGSYKLFGSSPESQIEVKGGKAYINPIAGTFRRTGNDREDQELAKRLAKDDKENAEHVMLVDLARNDLSRSTEKVTVEDYREIQFYSHVIHMVSRVSGILPKDADTIRIMAESFPAGTLSGAPKYRAMELIDRYEGKRRGYYGGTIGFIRFNGDINHAIMIRSFLSKNNALYYQAGAGIVAESVEKNELNEVNNKLMALKKAIDMA
ncbi:MAG: anthranilate synthase component I family protein, partial [Bacteroidales bacterium]|nr:anthranilate synthase component I family protein [Bacteroidales bacterium]